MRDVVITYRLMRELLMLQCKCEATGVLETTLETLSLLLQVPVFTLREPGVTTYEEVTLLLQPLSLCHQVMTMRHLDAKPQPPSIKLRVFIESQVALRPNLLRLAEASL